MKQNELKTRPTIIAIAVFHACRYIGEEWRNIQRIKRMLAERDAKKAGA